LAANASARRAESWRKLALKVIMKVRERRRVEVFVYGLFMDDELVRGKGPSTVSVTITEWRAWGSGVVRIAKTSPM
jgi:hypothetical protein